MPQGNELTIKTDATAEFMIVEDSACEMKQLLTLDVATRKALFPEYYERSRQEFVSQLGNHAYGHLILVVGSVASELDQLQKEVRLSLGNDRVVAITENENHPGHAMDLTIVISAQETFLSRWSVGKWSPEAVWTDTVSTLSLSYAWHDVGYAWLASFLVPEDDMERLSKIALLEHVFAELISAGYPEEAFSQIHGSVITTSPRGYEYSHFAKGDAELHN